MNVLGRLEAFGREIGQASVNLVKADEAEIEAVVDKVIAAEIPGALAPLAENAANTVIDDVVKVAETEVVTALVAAPATK